MHGDVRVEGQQAVSMRRRTLSPLIGALIFIVLYLAVSPVAGAFSTGEMPLPGAPAVEVHDYLAVNTIPSLWTGVLQGLSGVGLAIVVAGLSTAACERNAGLRAIRRVAGWVAVAAILVSAALSILLGIIAPTAGTDAVDMVRNISFYAGGVVHVVALGIFTLSIGVARRWSRTVRIVAWIAGSLAVLSLLSTVIYYASVFLPVGRLACMVALVVVGVSVLRRPPVAPAHESGTMVE